MTQTIKVVDIGNVEIPYDGVNISGTFARPASFTVSYGGTTITATITRDDTAKTVGDKIKRAVAEALNR